MIGGKGLSIVALSALLLITNYQLSVTGVAFAQQPLPTQPSYAADGPTQTCDLCGACIGQPPPPDYDSCMACSEKDNHTWTALGCLPTSPGGFVQSVLRVFTSAVGGVSFLALLYGGWLILTSAGQPERLETGKSFVLSSLVGIGLVVFAVFILQFIGVTVFEIPGFG